MEWNVRKLFSYQYHVHRIQVLAMLTTLGYWIESKSQTIHLTWSISITSQSLWPATFLISDPLRKSSPFSQMNKYIEYLSFHFRPISLTLQIQRCLCKRFFLFRKSGESVQWSLGCGVPNPHALSWVVQRGYDWHLSLVLKHGSADM